MFIGVEFVHVAFVCMAETLARTTAGTLHVGDRVNIERALRVGDEMGGHHVAGHVDVVGHIDAIEVTPNNRQVFVRFPDAEVRGTGVALRRVNPGALYGGLIPHTDPVLVRVLTRILGRSAFARFWCPRAGLPSTESA